MSLRWAGWVPFDAEVPEAVRRQRAVVELAPHAPVSRAFERLAQCVVDGPESVPPKGGLQFFFRRLLAEERA